MVKAIILFIVGLALLIKGGDWFVDGSVGIARRFQLPELLIGATVVSIGTTLPEVMVSASAAVGGHAQIAYGNAIGSIICNTALIAALTIAIRPAPVDRSTLKLPVIFFFGAACIYTAVAYTTGFFTRFTGIVLLAIFVVYMLLNVVQVKRDNTATAVQGTPETAQDAEISEKTGGNDEKEGKLWKDIVLLAIGAAMIAVGADLLVDNGTLIAAALGVPESVIALTCIALGTSLPELVTAITSLAKGHGALSVGNIIGANLFNIVLVSGLATTLSPYRIPCDKTIMGVNSSLLVDTPLMLIVMLILIVPTLIRGKLSRVQGISLLVLYAAFCVFQFVI